MHFPCSYKITITSVSVLDMLNLHLVISFVFQGRKLVWECLSRDDELLHVAVYEWLVSKQLGSGIKHFFTDVILKLLSK